MTVQKVTVEVRGRAITGTLQSLAAKRFAYWQDELTAAIAARDAKRIDACTRSLEKYGAMIHQAAAAPERGTDQQV